MNSDEIFAKLLEEKGMKWPDVMIDLVEWAENKYGKETPVDFSKDYPNFNDFIKAYFEEKNPQK